MKDSKHQSYEFGPFQLYVKERLLLRSGLQVLLPPKAFDTLVTLVANNGRLLSRDELMDKIWPDVAVEENNLSLNISILRRALSDGADEQQYIQTVSKGGYRFIAQVRTLSSAQDIIGETEFYNTIPKVFISYSWSSRQHQEWVKSLAERLMSDGVDVILDIWMLKEGQDKYAFMEQMVTDESVSKVLAICDKQYAEKADRRKGGVGTESQIISKEVYEKVDQNKFVAIVTEYGEQGDAYVPAFFNSRIFIDMSTEEKTLENYEQLLRFIFNRPQHIKPAIGRPPAYLFEDTGVASKTAHKLAMIKRAILEDRGSVPGLVFDYLKSYSAALEDYRIDERVTNEFDEKVIATIDSYTPYRDEFIDFINFVLTYREDERVHQEIALFFEGLIKYLYRPPDVSNWHEFHSDNYRFMLWELFLYHMTGLIKHQRFEQANALLSQGYFDRYLAELGQGTLRNYCVFDQSPQSLDEHRKRRLNINLFSVTGDMLHKRAYHKELNFEALIQADFILFLRSTLHPQKSYYRDYWYPRLIGYAEYHGVFEFFVKSASRMWFKNLMTLLNVQSKQELEEKYKAAVEAKRVFTGNAFMYVNVEHLMNLSNLDSF